MILGDPTVVLAAQQGQRRASIDEVFRRIAQKNPEKVALADAPNRSAFTDGAPRRLTYAQADRMVAAIAGRLRRMGMATDTIVGIQLPNTVENILTILGVLRAGMIAAPLPLLWRRAEAIAALARIGGKALITCGRAGSFNHSQFAMRIASEVFSIRYVCGFGDRLPDGVVPFDDLYKAERLDPIPPLERDRLANAAAHIGLITFDVGDSGIVPVARNHMEMLAGGLGVTLESKLAQDSRILSTVPPSSFAGFCVTLMPWLLSAGTLCLHHPFDAEVLAQQRRDDACGTLILPGAVAIRLAESGLFARERGGTVVATWRAPERLATSPVWRERDTGLVDVSIFGEAGLIAARRGAGGRSAPIPFGPVVAPRGSSGAVIVAELVRTQASTVALRGPMVPRYSFPPGIERSGLPHFPIDRFGLVDTGYTCRVDAATRSMVVTGPPSGIVSVGGYRFPLRELQDAVGRIDSAATVAAVPDPVIGQRLIGNATKPDVVQAALTAVGVNPLVAAAFRDRGDRGEPARG
ncbi:MAG TPA: class I adenylate-forming enzyme family protein [Xanthobacteraceae bacterium]|nr:class I adenylate-forming enzyme family protein [Xanthobacteraceae bacterium]